MASKLISVEYKVYGKVQGVFFRKYTAQTAKMHKLVGWVKNDDDGTVVGLLQGSDRSINMMKEWLSKKGSPKCVINKCEFNNEKEITRVEYDDFLIKK